MLALALVFCGGPLRAESFEDGLRAFRAGEPGRAHDIWLPLAGEGDAAAQYSLGKLFEHGEGPIHQDLTKAVYWYESAATQGLPAAQNNLALMYAQGRGVSNDLGRAIELWRAAAEKSYPWAQYNLGLAYFRGQGVAIDQAEAAVWFRRAADGGLAEAQFIMGQLKREGLGLEKDEGQALAWYHRAAEQGHLRARKQANALKAEGVEPVTPSASEVQELTTSMSKGSKPRNGSKVDTSAEAKAPPKQPKVKPKPGVLKAAEAEPKAAGKSAKKQQSAEAVNDPKKAEKESALKAKATPKQTTQAEDPTKAKPSAAGSKAKEGAKPERKAKAEPKAKLKAEKATKPATELPSETFASENSKAGEKNKAAATPEPLVGKQSARNQNGSRSKSKPAATQNAALKPRGAEPSEANHENGYRIWLASAGSRDKATKLWRTVQDRHRSILGEVDVDFAEVDLGGEALFRVLAGPVASAAEAERLCERLREAQPDAFCKVRAD